MITAGENEAHVLRLLRLTPPRQRPLFPVYPPAIAMKRVLFLSALILAGCGVTDNTDGLSALERAEYEAEIDATVRALEIAIGQARAEDVDACRELPLGQDACGNATYSRIYSLTDGDTPTILELAALATRLGREYDAALGLERECRVFQPRELILEGGQCTTEPEIAE